jgi:hypothetical protein
MQKGGDILVSWGRAWRGAGARFGWNIVWGIAGIAIFGAGLFIMISAVSSIAAFDPYRGFNYNGIIGSSIVGVALMLVGWIIQTLGSWATFFKINSEIVAEEVNRQLGRITQQQTNMGSPPVAGVASSMCPTCGGALIYDFQAKRWYCQREAKYI